MLNVYKSEQDKNKKYLANINNIEIQNEILNKKFNDINNK